MKKRTKNAFGIIELIIVVLFLGFFAVIAVPRLNLAAVSKNKAQTVAAKIVNDLRLARRLAISDAANNAAGFGLSMIGGPDYNGYEIKNLNTLVTQFSHSIDPEVSCKGGSNFEFGPLGNLKAGSGTELYVEAEGISLFISVTPATGTVKCTEN
jgi:type II secretory pathway pseudopilin PulG